MYYGTSGSGKTTLINILSTIDEATSGKLLIFDQNIVGCRIKKKQILERDIWDLFSRL